MMQLAAVDLGSNSFRMEICRVHNGQLVSELYHKEMVRLAAGLDDNQILCPEKQREALQTLAHFRELLASVDSDNIRVVATQTLRVAKNAADFINEAQRALNHPIEIIAGREEARLVFAGCSSSLPLSNERRFIIDIGGGSTELAIGRGMIPKRCESFHVGCVNMSMRFFKDGCITEKGMQQAELYARSEFEEVLHEFDCSHWDQAYGSAGTVGALAEVARCLGINEGVVTNELLAYFRRQFIALGHVSRFKGLPGLKEDRREVIAGGLAVLSAVFKTFNVSEMRPAAGALRMGVLQGLLQRKSLHDIRDSSVRHILQDAQLDKAQAYRVSGLADALYTSLTDNDTSEARKHLQWASILHEIGKKISPSRYHHHGAYITRSADLAGFSHSDQLIISTLILSQRGKLFKIQNLSENPTLIRQVLCLRLAVIFAHARQTITLPSFQLIENPLGISLRIERSWLELHPLTTYMLQTETNTWAEIGLNFSVIAQ